MSGHESGTPGVPDDMTHEVGERTMDELLGEREIVSPQAMEQLGREIGERLRAGDVVVLTGALGAGKTTLTRGIAAGLGVRGPIQSPTS